MSIDYVLIKFEPNSERIPRSLLQAADVMKSRRIFDTLRRIHPNVAKAGGLQSQGVEGEAVVVYREPLTTPDLMSSAFPAG